MFYKVGNKFVNLDYVTDVDVREIGSYADTSVDPPQYYSGGLLTVLSLTLYLPVISGGNPRTLRAYSNEAEDIKKAID